MIDSEKRMNDYANLVNRDVFSGIDWLGLKQAYTNQNYEYPKTILKKLHDKFSEIYGTETLDDSYDFILAPAVIRVRESGDLYIGLVQLDLSSSGEHWGTDFITHYGVLSIDDDELNEDQLKYVRSLHPYDYWYPADIENDIHIDKGNIPNDVREMLAFCNSQYQTEQPQGGMSLQ